MNPYEKYYMRKKVSTGLIAVGAVAVIGGATLLLKPWNWIPKNDDPPPVTDQQQQPSNEQVTEQESDLTITVAGKKVECKLYQGDGWTIPVPMDWEIEEADGKVHFYPEGGHKNTLRLNFSNAAVPQINEGMERLASVIKEAM